MKSNYEIIKQMSVEEMAELLRRTHCEECSDYYYYNHKLNKKVYRCLYSSECDNKTIERMKQWLGSEAEDE